MSHVYDVDRAAVDRVSVEVERYPRQAAAGREGVEAEEVEERRRTTTATWRVTKNWKLWNNRKLCTCRLKGDFDLMESSE